MEKFKLKFQVGDDAEIATNTFSNGYWGSLLPTKGVRVKICGYYGDGYYRVKPSQRIHGFTADDGTVLLKSSKLKSVNDYVVELL